MVSPVYELEQVPSNVLTYSVVKKKRPVGRKSYTLPKVPGGHECNVCYRQIVGDFDKVGRMPCKHVTCFKCLQKWVDKGHQSCPECVGKFHVYMGEETIIDD